MAKSTTRNIVVNELARVEGEGALRLRIRDGKIKELNFRIHEPPRFFEALLQGKDFSEAPDITSRICGICPIAYIMGASQAMEDALKVDVPRSLKDLRRLIYCGEWMESHVLHVFLLHAPDFMGYQDAILISRDHPELVATALRLKKLGNRILEVIGGRAVHPVNLKVGGFYKAPSKAEVMSLREELEWGVKTSLELVKTVSSFDFPEYNHDYNCVALKHPDEYGICEGRMVSTAGMDIDVGEFENHFDEEHVDYSNALHGVSNTGKPYLLGPIARYNLNFEQLSPLAQNAAKEAGLPRTITNPFMSIAVRMVEVLYACEEALRLVNAYVEPNNASVLITPGAGEGCGATEAPRGTCYHRYKLDDQGKITFARIMPPTSQNQKQIEQDLWGVVERYMDLPDETLKWRCEQAIRNYDPCISCATHFLQLSVDRD